MRYTMPIIIGIFLAFLFFVQPSYGAINHIVFRLVLNEEELATQEYDTIINDNNEVLKVSKLYFLSDPNIDEVMIFKSAVTPDKIMTGLRFNEQGKKQLSLILKKFPNHKIAIFASKTFITTLPALPADFSSDMIVITWPRKEKELRWIAREINRKPPSLLTLYIDETAKYNDRAADQWAKVYENVTAMLEKKRQEAPREEPEY